MALLNHVVELALANPIFLAFGSINLLFVVLIYLKRHEKRRDLENASSPSTPRGEKNGYSEKGNEDGDGDEGVLLEGFEELGRVKPLEGFEWEKEEQEKIRPFKAVYHMTMALEKSSLNNLVVMDQKYLDRIMERKRVMDLYPSTTIGHLPAAVPAIGEFWELMTKLLPTRFPSMFSATSSPSSLHNLVTSQTLSPDSSDPNSALRAISASLDEDFLLLLPAADNDGYILGAHIACFPAGFDISQKLGWRVRDIHGPVPGYKEKLKTSMERYFERLKVGSFVKRCNWSVVTSERLFTAFEETHFHAGVGRERGEKVERDGDGEVDGVDAEACWQRTESQTLFRLPKSGALVFAIKTYLYTMKELREEGNGEAFAEAIEGLTKGSVPEVFEYKRGPVWKDTVLRYLRAEDGRTKGEKA